MGKLINFLKIIVILIALIIVGIINFYSINGISNVTMTARLSEHVNVSESHYIWLIGLVALVVVGVLFYQFAQHLQPKWLFLGCSLITIVFGIYLIKTAPQLLRADQYKCLVAATNLNKHDFIDFKPIWGYLDKYPYQLGFITFERLIVSKLGLHAVWGIFSLNLVSVVVINFTLWQITRLIFKNKVIENYQILLNFLFIPEVLYVLFAYGTLMGFACLLIGIFFALRQWQEKRKLDWLWSALFLVAAYQLKTNYLIGIIAVVIWSLIDFIKNHKWQNLLLIVVSLGLVVGSNQFLNHYYTNYVGKEVSVSGGVPKNLFVVMGLSKSKRRSDGWYNRYTIEMVKKYRGNYAKAKEQGNEDLKKRLNEMTNEPTETTKFFKDKLVTTWTDPLFQAIWNGPHKRYGQVMNSRFLDALYNNPRSRQYRIAVNFAHAFYVFALFLSLVGLVKLLKYRQSIPVGAALLVTYLIGGVLFHLIWETKSQYVINYFMALLPLAGMGAELLFRKLSKILTRKR